jgi:uncharacterized protein (AIM24 family)
MEYEIRNRPSFANIRIHLKAGDELIAEADAMASMSPSLTMKTRWSGGVLKGIARRVFGSRFPEISNALSSKTARFSFSRVRSLHAIPE